MARPYNFFQFSESGVTGSGIVAAYRGFLSGFFTPSGMFDTPRGHFNALGDYIDAHGYLPTYSIQITGEQQGIRPDEYTLSARISGSFYPLNSGVASLSTVFSGSVESGTRDDNNYSLVVTGEMVSGNIDAPSFSLRPSGKIAPFGLDTPTYSLAISGDVTPELLDTPTYSLVISGNIVKYEKDNVSLLTEITSITYSGFGARVSLTTGDDAVLDIDFGSIIYSVGGG